MGQRYFGTKDKQCRYCPKTYSSYSARKFHEAQYPWNPNRLDAAVANIPVPDLDEAISGPKRIIADITQQLPEPEASKISTPTSLTEPPSKVPRIESAAEPPQVTPPEAPAGAEEPSILTQPLTQELAVPQKVRRTINPAIKAAKQRIKRNVTKRSLAPHAGGMVRAKR